MIAAETGGGTFATVYFSGKTSSAFLLNTIQTEYIHPNTGMKERKIMRRIIGWRRTSGKDWKITMARMKQRMETAQNYYYCVSWSEKFAQAQWE